AHVDFSQRVQLLLYGLRQRRLYLQAVQYESQTSSCVRLLNLLSHLATKHPDHLAVFEASQQGQTLQNHGFVDARAMEIFKWMEWVIMRNLPLSEVDDTLTRGLAGIKPVSSQTLLRHMRHVTCCRRLSFSGTASV
ncbi:hypothetical protein L915_21173, partial [Phytophthora nicotianae]